MALWRAGPRFLDPTADANFARVAHAQNAEGGETRASQRAFFSQLFPSSARPPISQRTPGSSSKPAVIPPPSHPSPTPRRGGLAEPRGGPRREVPSPTFLPTLLACSAACVFAAPLRFFLLPLPGTEQTQKGLITLCIVLRHGTSSA